MYNSLSEVKFLQLDHTSRCNLACPQCARMDDDVINPYMNIADLTLDDYKIILEPWKDSPLRQIFHCGNFGDVIASPTFDETIEFQAQHCRKLKIATNGSARKPEWWASLPERTNNKTHVVFAFDGLRDTNHIYRIGSNWDIAWENALAYIRAGGYAEWSFIEFEHNYHQIEEARQIANDNGFKQFTVKYTSRFAQQQQTQQVTRKKTVVKEKANHNNTDYKKVVKKHKTFETYTKKTDIVCKFQKDYKLFIDMNMKLWPCCWFGAPDYLDPKNEQWKDFANLRERYGENFNSLREHGWDVFNHEFFQTYLQQSWEKNPDYPRIFTCGRTCGNSYEFSSGYGKNIKTL